VSVRADPEQHKIEPGRRAYETSDGNIIIEKTGAKVRIIEGLPNGIDSTAILKMLG